METLEFKGFPEDLNVLLKMNITKGVIRRATSSTVESGNPVTGLNQMSELTETLLSSRALV